MEFTNVFANGTKDQPRRGDRLIYDRRNGTVSLYRGDADLTFATAEGEPARQHVFVGMDWTPALTGATATLYARLGHLEGRVVRIEGSFVTLETWEIVA
jgi:hypothetical protein